MLGHLFLPFNAKNFSQVDAIDMVQYSSLTLFLYSLCINALVQCVIVFVSSDASLAPHILVKSAKYRVSVHYQ